MNKSDEEIKKKIAKIVSETENKLTPQSIEKAITKYKNYDKNKIKYAIKNLIEEGELEYTNFYGNTYIEKSFNKPIRVSHHILLSPPNLNSIHRPGDIEILLNKGVSFGSGAHPTTRLSIRGIEYVFRSVQLFVCSENVRALDIGTGSGVLTITSVRLGVSNAIGLDIDSCSRKEANENVILNNCEGKITITGESVFDMKGSFDLITANLRLPTIISLFTKLNELTKRSSVLIISGIKVEEVEKVLNIYTERVFDYKWKKVEKGWACLVLIKK